MGSQRVVPWGRLRRTRAFATRFGRSIFCTSFSGICGWPSSATDRRASVEDFARAIEATKLVHFLGKQRSIEPYLQRAAVVWVPSRTSSGVCTRCSGVIAGRLVVAMRLPELRK